MAAGGHWLNLLGSLPLIALGFYVAWLRPRTAGKTAFGLFMMAFGANFVSTNLFELVGLSTIQALHPADKAVRLVIATVMVLFLAVSLPRFPRPLVEGDRRTWRGLLAIGAVQAALIALYAILRPIDPVPTTDLSAIGLVLSLLNLTWASLLLLFQVLLAWRFTAVDDARFRQQLALTAAGLAVFTGFTTGAATHYELDPFGTDGATIGRLIVVGFGTMVAAASWGWALVVGDDKRSARNLLLLTLAMPLVGALYAVWLDYNGVYGVVRLLSFAILTYAIVKHQLLGIDVKLRVAIKGSTLAAIFIGVFFVTSELAQQFFGARYQNQYIGIAAAGGLVFAMAPLQRLADRVATKAVPVVGAPGAGAEAWQVADAESNELTYGLVLAKFLRDGKVTREEERALARVATRLGVSAERALAVREAAEPGAVPQAMPTPGVGRRRSR